MKVLSYGEGFGGQSLSIKCPKCSCFMNSQVNSSDIENQFNRASISQANHRLL